MVDLSWALNVVELLVAGVIAGYGFGLGWRLAHRKKEKEE